MPKEQSVVGDLINFRGLVYSPVNEQGVVYLFSKVAEDLNMYVEEVRTAFPDCVARRFNGKGWERIYIEFEFLSSNFQGHNHNPADCDMIVCWEHDWKDCPLEVLELRSIIKGLRNWEIRRPDAGPGPGPSVTELFERWRIPPAVRNLYDELEPKILAVGDRVWRKVTERNVTFYSPRRVFIYLRPQQAGLRLLLFTRGQPIPGVTPLGYQAGGFKWGRIRARTQADVPAVVEACREAYVRILQAIGANEPTGWYAPVEAPEMEGAEEDDAVGPPGSAEASGSPGAG